MYTLIETKLKKEALVVKKITGLFLPAVLAALILSPAAAAAAGV